MPLLGAVGLIQAFYSTLLGFRFPTFLLYGLEMGAALGFVALLGSYELGRGIIVALIVGTFVGLFVRIYLALSPPRAHRLERPRREEVIRRRVGPPTQIDLRPPTSR